MENDNGSKDNNDRLFAKVGRLYYSHYITDSFRDQWCPYRNVNENDVNHVVEKAKKL